ncbi:MAG: hypothetical protein ABL951_04220 [Alphaproteobacteria bacterium]
MNKFFDYVGTNWKKILISVMVMILLYFLGEITGVWSKLRSLVKGHKHAGANDGSTPRPGYDPAADASSLHTAFAGAGTDEDSVWNVMGDLNNAEKALLWKEYKQQFGGDLVVEGTDELSSWMNSEDVQRWKDYWQGIEFS